MDSQKKVRVGVFLGDELLRRCDAAIPLTDCRSRSEFIAQAIDEYVARVNMEGDASVLFPMLDESLDGRMKDQEMRLTRALFKLAVEVAIMTHIVAATNDITETQLAAVRKLCTQEVAKLSGRYSIEDAVKFQV